MSPYTYQYQPQRVRFGPSITPMVKYLIIINVAVFIIQLFTKSYYVGYAVDNTVIPVQAMTYYFGLVPSLVLGKGYLWQLVTYMFLHSPFLWIHIVFNMWMLWMFGSELEAIWGWKKFLTYYFFTGIGAGLCSLFFYHTPVIGASGAIFGLLLAYGMIYPERVLLIMGIFPMKARNTVILFGVISLFLGLRGKGSIAHFAHLGGLLFGYIYMKNFGNVQSWLNLQVEFSHKPKRRTDAYSDDEKNIEFSMLDINRILDKISKEGIRSLTPREKKILEKAKDRIDEL